MKPALYRSVLTAIAFCTGFVVLAGYFYHSGPLLVLRNTLLNWGLIFAGVALLVGVANLAQVHWLRVKDRRRDWGYSGILLFSLFLTLAVAVYYGPTAQASMWLYTTFQVPLETSMFALLCILLIYALIRLLSRKFEPHTTLFIATVFLVILGTISLPGSGFSTMREIRNWVAQVWAGAGARGVLLGVALGTLAAGIRVLVGMDRPYND